METSFEKLRFSRFQPMRSSVHPRLHDIPILSRDDSHARHLGKHKNGLPKQFRMFRGVVCNHRPSPEPCRHYQGSNGQGNMGHSRWIDSGADLDLIRHSWRRSFVALGNNQCSELMELLRSWDSLSSPLRTAIMAIVRTAKDTPDQ